MGIEALGIIGTVCVVIAFLQDGETTIRRLDAVGAAFFIVYGTLLPSFSTILLNCILLLVQLWKLRKLRVERKQHAE